MKAWLQPGNLALVLSTTMITAAVLTGCSAHTESKSAEPKPAPAASSSVASTPTALPAESSADGDYSVLCDANDAAAAAKAGTVGEDLKAVNAQVSTIRGLLPLQGVSTEVAAGAKVFAAAAEEDAAILAQFPDDSLVSDVGLDPKFTEAKAVQNALSDPNYQAFIVWTMQMCGSGSDEG